MEGIAMQSLRATVIAILRAVHVAFLLISLSGFLFWVVYCLRATYWLGHIPIRMIDDPKLVLMGDPVCSYMLDVLYTPWYGDVITFWWFVPILSLLAYLGLRYGFKVPVSRVGKWLTCCYAVNVIVLITVGWYFVLWQMD